MSRSKIFGLLAFSAVLFSNVISADDPKPAKPPGTLVLGKSLSGDLTGERMLVWTNNAGESSGYQTRIPVFLEAGQSITISASVIGKNRHVGVLLADPKLTELSRTNGSDVKATELVYEEVPSTGQYTILVFSDLVGPFEVRAVDGESAEEVETTSPNATGLEKRVKQLEEEVQSLKEAIEALKKSRR